MRHIINQIVRVHGQDLFVRRRIFEYNSESKKTVNDLLDVIKGFIKSGYLRANVLRKVLGQVVNDKTWTLFILVACEIICQGPAGCSKINAQVGVSTYD